ncbi:MAG: xylose isomerase [Gemmatimonadetes bacterium]|nr:xylose isomerase [Gemmatimonadota bacterium]
MPTLRTFANLWTLWDHPGAGPDEWTVSEKVAAVAAAGFDGVMGDPGTGLGALARAHGLAFIAFLRLDVTDDVTNALARCAAEQAIGVQVHLGWHDTAPDAALAAAQRLLTAARDLALDVVIETHRDTCTETPEKTDALCARYEAATGSPLPLLFDFSHHAVVKHLQPPFAPRLLADAERVRRARWFHLRPFNGHHAQIPVRHADGSPAPEMADWLAFVDALFALLHTAPQAECWVCPEIGPVRGGYGLAAFPPSWTQAVELRRALVSRWDARALRP